MPLSIDANISNTVKISEPMDTVIENDENHGGKTSDPSTTLGMCGSEHTVMASAEKQMGGKKTCAKKTGRKMTGKKEQSQNMSGEKQSAAKETVEKEAGGMEAVEKQFDHPWTQSVEDSKLVLSFSGGLAVVNPELHLKQENIRQETFKKTLTKKSTKACPPLESRKYFFPFKKLPTELRQEIWKLELAAREPRIIKIYYDEKKKKTQIRSKTGVPVILHVCLESREIGLKVYKKLVINNYFTGTFVEWERDLIYINSEKCLNSIMALPEMKSGRADLNQMCRRLAIDEKGLWSFISDFEEKTRLLKFPKLEELIKVSSVNWRDMKKPDRQVASFKNVTYNVPGFAPGDDRGAQVLLRFFKRNHKPIIKIRHKIPIPSPYLMPKQKATKKEQAERDRVCDAEMLAAYELQTSIGNN